ncbi:MAG: hypothetical protein Fur0018_09160 [Anaerolineales bacterium]
MEPLRQPKILYIEDTESARILVRRLLGASYLVLEASNPLDGLALARDTHPDLVLLDINLPHMSGREVATRLRSILPNAPLVALTADATTGSREKALAAGCIGFITKPIDIDTFPDEIAAYLNGKRDLLENEPEHMQAYHAELVEHLETKVRELTEVVERNDYLNRQNRHIIAMLERRQHLLEAAARVSHGITSILSLDELLRSTVDILCDEFSLYYSGIFLLSDDGEWAVLRAGYGEAGARMLETHFRLHVDRHSMIGSSILEKKALIALDVEGETSHFRNPLLPQTRSEAALPLVVQGRPLGAITVQSAALNAFSSEDVAALESLADQIAIAINNARLLQQLEAANAELLRTKTFEAIATATGEAIHWVGNKAAPIPGSAQRLREDLLTLLAAIRHAYLKQDGPSWPLAAVWENLLEEAEAQGFNLDERANTLASAPKRRQRALLSVESMFEDLQIIENSATTILNIKEDLIGPARQRQETAFALPDTLAEVIHGMGYPKDVLSLKVSGDPPRVYADARQIGRVFINLIKNAWEALAGHPQPRITIHVANAPEAGFVEAIVQDNGPGIPRDIQEKIWVSFFTTKGERGGTGLGLPACMQIITQSKGKLWVESQPGEGAAFHIWLPVAQENHNGKV